MRAIVEQQLDPARHHRVAVDRVGVMHAAQLVGREADAEPDSLAGLDRDVDELALPRRPRRQVGDRQARDQLGRQGRRLCGVQSISSTTQDLPSLAPVMISRIGS